MKFKVFKYKKVKSTNNTAIRIIRETNHNFGMIISETQTGGKGQYGRKWISYKGNILISFFYKLKKINLSMKQLSRKNCFLVKVLFRIKGHQIATLIPERCSSLAITNPSPPL